LKTAIDNVAQVEIAKIMGENDKRVADRIIKNLNTCIKSAEEKIEL
jgi:hypothetical protein